MSTDEKREPEAGAAEEEEEEDGEWEEFDAPVPPDGGWGWVVMISCFLSNVIVDGVCYTYSVFFNELREHFEASRSKTALVGSLVPAFYLLVGTARTRTVRDQAPNSKLPQICKINPRLLRLDCADGLKMHYIKTLGGFCTPFRASERDPNFLLDLAP